MKQRIRFILTAYFLIAVQVVFAQSYQSGKLKKAAVALNIHEKVGTLPSGKTSELFLSNGQKVMVRIGENQTVEHIGAPLFGGDIRMLMPSPVYDFIEYAVLNKKYRMNANQLNLSKVIFKKGSWDILANGRLDECECSIENIDDKLYVVSWQRNGDDIAIVGIPIEYELLNNDSRRNIERNFVKEVETWKIKNIQDSIYPVSEDDLKIYGTGGLFVCQGESYMVDELNQNTYYELKTIQEFADTVIHNKAMRISLETVKTALVVSQEFPAETLANLILSNDNIVADINMVIDFHLSDYHRQKIEMPYKQLKDYVSHQGCKLYFACSGIKNNVVRGVILVSNRAKGYNHLFSVSIPVNCLTEKDPVINAAAYLYIPPIEKAKMFSRVPTKKSGAKIY